MHQCRKTGDTEFRAKVVTRVGPLKVNFTGIANYVDVIPQDSFTINGHGEGGPAGFAKGSVKITLENIGPNLTRLSYVAQTSLGGKIAALGGRLLEAISRRNIDQFFAALQAELSGEVLKETPPISEVQPIAATGSHLRLLNTILLAAIAVALWIIALK